MSLALLPALAAYIPRDRVGNILQPDYPLAHDGVALIADISGFTPLTEALTHGLSPDQGAEELTRALDGVFTPLIEQIHAFRGSVIKFGGDALIVWYGREPRGRRAAVARRAITSAWRMQQAIRIHGQVPTPIGVVTLKMKVGLSYGPVKRFNLGLSEYGYEDVLGGHTLDRMAEAEHQAEPGEIVLDAGTLAQVPTVLSVAEWRGDFAAIGQLLRPARPKTWPPLQWSPEAENTLTERLISYVPPVIYQTLASGRAQVAELKPVVSLFVQFHGIDYDADPDVGRKLQTYFATAQQVVNRYGGRLNRLITGDKGSLIHVIFGAPRTVEEQEARAVRCALDLQRECGGLPFITTQRIGVTVGRVFAGPVGSPIRHDYTTMGDSVNLSARLMQNAANDQVLLEAAVRAQLGAEFEVADLGEIMVKGKLEPIPVFAAVSAQAQPNRVGHKRSPRRTMPLFGRDKELALLRERLLNMANGQGGIITLVGEVGMGKTHILADLQAQVGDTIAWAGGMCLAYGQTLSGYLFIDLLRDLLELPPGASPEETSQHLLDFCADLFGQTRLEATYPYLAKFMGLPLGGEYAQRLEGLAGESLRWQLFEVVHEMLGLLPARRPLVLALDDLQWADPTSLQLVESILPLALDRPILLLLSMRPERDSKAWAVRGQALGQAPGQVLDITLSDLGRAAASRLIAHYAPDLPDRIVAYLIEKGGGNPLFLVELVRTLQAQGLLSGEVDLNSLEIDALDLPDSVQGLLLAQIDRLAVEARHTLQMASVIGKSFLHKVLEALAAGEQRLTERLATLETDEFILPDDPTDLGLAYTFRHILIQESAYSTLLYERRRAYHRQVAEALERLFPALIAEQAGLLGFHYERADDLDQASYYHLQAADEARLLYANEEAEALYRKVLTLLDQQEAAGAAPDLDRRAKTYLKIAQVRSNTLDFEGAQEFYDRAFELLEQVERLRPQKLAAARDGARTIRLGVFEPETPDPGLGETTGSIELAKNLFEGLVELDNELNIIPAVARRWQIDKGGKRYKFELRPNLKWSDGAPLTANDFVFAWRRNLSAKTGAGLAHLLYVVEGAEEFHQGKNVDPNSIGIRALDDLSLEISLKAPTSHFPYLLSWPATYPQPAHIIQAKGLDWCKFENLVCNGPFKIVNWKQDREIYLEKNPLYRGFAAGNLEKVFLHFAEPGSDLERYTNDEIDWCRVENQTDLLTHYPGETFIMQYLTTYFLGFSCNYPPFNRRLVRQAFAKSIDQRKLVKEVWSNVQKPAIGGIVPPGMPGHSPEIGLRFDSSTARDLLKKAGFEPSSSLPPLTLAASIGFSTTPNYLQESWREHLGINVDVIIDIPIKELLTNLSQGSIQFALIGWDVEYPDPDGIFRLLFHSTSPINYFGWQNNQFDQLVEQAAGSTDQQARLALYHQADRVLVAEDTAVVPLYYWQAYGLMRPGFSIEGAGKIIRGGTFKLKNIVAS